MTTAYQWVFDNAEQISIQRGPNVAQTITRSNVVRTVSRGGDVWRFEVKMPDGLPWTVSRPYLEAINSANRYTNATVQINRAGYNSWFMNYQGNSVSTTGFVATATQGSNQLTLTASPTTTSGYKFRAGDLIQLGSGKAYTVAADVAFNSNTVTVHRPVLDANGSYALVVGPAVTFTVVCVQLPQWNVFSRNQVSWNGTFAFSEVI